MAAKVSLNAQAEAVRIIAEKALPGTKALSAAEVTLLSERADAAVATLKLFAKHEDAIRDCIRVREHLEKNGGERG